MARDGFQCGRCGKWHDGLPMSWDFAAPVYWDPRDRSVKNGESELTEDLCIIQRDSFFMKGNLEIPLIGQDSFFSFSIWTSLSREAFERATKLWKDPDRINEPPYFGWFSSSVPGYPDTINLKTNVHTRGVGVKPLIELEPSEHPLAIEQRSGITLTRVAEIAAILVHGS